MIVLGNTLTASTISDSTKIENDSLRVELAKAQYIALQSDSALIVYYEIQQELGKKVEVAKKELNRYIIENKALRENNTDLSKKLVKANNKVAKARKNKFIWFGAGTGVGAVTVISILLIAK